MATPHKFKKPSYSVIQTLKKNKEELERLNKIEQECDKVIFDGRPFATRSCLKIDLNFVKSIFGPSEFYYYENINGRKFYLFGEYHQKLVAEPPQRIGNTLLFTSFIHSLVTTYPHKTYDLFFEEPGSSDSDSDILNKILFQFDDCIQPSKRVYCPYNNFRIHFINMRLRPGAHQLISFLEQTPINLPEFKRKLIIFLNSRIIQKQFRAIENTYISTLLNQFFLSKIALINMSLSSLDYNTFHTYTSLIMDMYSIPRILRSFSSKIKKGNQFAGTSENVIYYTGNYHTLFLKEFLETIRIKPTYSITNGRKSFININDDFLRKFH